MEKHPTINDPIYTTTGELASCYGTEDIMDNTPIHLWKGSDGFWHIEPDDTQLSPGLDWDDEYAPRDDTQAEKVIRCISELEGGLTRTSKN